MSDPRFLTALPVFNEAAHVMPVLDAVARHASDMLVVDDGSTDGTAELLDGRGDVYCIRHPQNQGYGAALKTAFDYAISARYDILVTIDCDGQHEPQRIQELVAACREVDIVSGSRYLDLEVAQGEAPAERRQINHQITRDVNERLGLSLTDTFCGFKAYRVSSLAQIAIAEPGYGMPLELWVQAAHHGLRIVEIPVPLIYLDEKRSFGGSLDDGRRRLEYYHQVIDRALAAVAGPVQLRRELDARAAGEDSCPSSRVPCCRDK